MRRVVNHLDFIVAAVVAALYLLQDQGVITISAETAATLVALAAIARGGLHRSRESKRKNVLNAATPNPISDSDTTPVEPVEGGRNESER